METEHAKGVLDLPEKAQFAYPHLAMYPKYWTAQPALFYGLALAFGFGVSLGHSILLLPALFCMLSAAARQAIYFAAVFVVAASYLSLSYTLPDASCSGTAIYTVNRLSEQQGRFGASSVAFGVVETLCDEQGTVRVRRAAANCYLKGKVQLVPGMSYRVPATLKVGGRTHQYQLKVKRHAKWELERAGWSLEGWRSRVKQRIHDSIERRIQSPSAVALLHGLITGEFDDQLGRMEFGRLGLQHVMAISGFHFALVAMLLSSLLRPLASHKVQAMLMLLALSTYFLFIGARPSVGRAWVAILIHWAGQLWGRECTSLHALGLAMIWVLLVDPLALEQIGFLFSFTATAGILLLYPIVDEMLSFIFKRRYLGQIVALPLSEQQLLLVAGWLRQACALTLAVHVAVAPLMLSMFHKMSVLSLVYNLFFPFLVSIAIVALILGSFLPFIDSLNRIYCEFLLDIVYQAPSGIDFAFRARELSSFLVVSSLGIIMFWGLRANTLRYNQVKC